MLQLRKEILKRCYIKTACYFNFLVGCYKPRVRCYDVSQMSMKFERCLDSDSEYFIDIKFSIFPSI